MLGAGVALALAARSDHVTVLQRRPAGLGLPEVLSDVADTDAVRAAVSGHDAVIHLAAKVNVTGSWAQYEHANVVGTRSVVEACRRAGVERLVHVSSPSVAHAGSSLIGVGAGPANPEGARGAYSKSKAIAEQIALAADGPELSVVAVRPHIVWGPGDTQLVARIVERARRGRLPMIGSGAALIDSTYVTNAVDALVAALDRCGRAHGRALVVTNGEPRPIAELLGGMCAAAGVPRPQRSVPRPVAMAIAAMVEKAWSVRSRGSTSSDADPPMTRFVVEQMSTAHWFDQRETQRLLDWRPTISLDDGLAELARWFGH
jgi:2-alkyl-3-oxoalkanoate reductase